MKYDLDSADILLTRDELRFIADSLELLADLDEGENWNDTECRRIAAYARENLYETSQRVAIDE